MDSCRSCPADAGEVFGMQNEGHPALTANDKDGSEEDWHTRNGVASGPADQDVVGGISGPQPDGCLETSASVTHLLRRRK
jgi:hypothetical protein